MGFEGGEGGSLVLSSSILIPMCLAARCLVPWATGKERVPEKNPHWVSYPPVGYLDMRCLHNMPIQIA